MAVIIGTAGNDTLVGTAENDQIYGLLGNDQLAGGLGKDVIFGEEGIDSLEGGNGDDILEDLAGTGNTLRGDAGNDQINTSNGSIIDGGAGTDLLSFYGSAAISLTLNANGSGTGTDGTSITGIEEFYFAGGVGNDNVNASATTYQNSLNGGSGNDTLVGGSSTDYIVDVNGVNLLNGGGGDDFIDANVGSNIDGGSGIDHLTLTSRLDPENPGTSIDPNVSLTFSANGVATGSDGTVINGIESFAFAGGNGQNNINAAATTYTNDLNGGTANDTLVSGSGDDYLAGGIGNNSLVGGAGNDYYTLEATGRNIINDASGINDTLLINSDINLATAFRRSGTTLIIDINNDQQFDTNFDSSIINFYTDAGGIGSGYIENIQGRSSQDIFQPVTSDFGSDRRSDILWRQSNGSVTMWQMDGTNIASNSTIANTVDASWQIIDNGDFNGDGAADILWYNTSGAVSLWQMNGSTIQTAGLVSAGVETSWKIATTGDFNGDSKTDIFWRNTNGDVAIWLMDGQSIVSSTVLGKVDSIWKTADTGDFNNDGRSDIIWQNDNGDVALWEMNGPSVANGNIVARPGVAWTIAGVNDFNDDGKAEVLLQNTDGRLALGRMGVFTSGLSINNLVGNVPVGFNVVGTGDFNGDRLGDILLRNAEGNNAIWNTDGTQLTTFNNIASSDVNWTLAAPNS